MTKAFETRITREHIVDTAKYRYVLTGSEIRRIERYYLDTTATLGAKSALNPNGWETIKTLNK